MAHLDLNEPLVAALVAKLQTGLPATIAEINAGITDGFLLEAPAQVFDYVPSQREVGAAGYVPVIGIQDLPSTFQDDIGSSATGVHGLAVLIFVAHAERVGLARLLRRWQRAVATVCLDERRIGDVGWGVTLRSISPGPTLDRQEDPRGVQSFTGVVIQARVDE